MDTLHKGDDDGDDDDDNNNNNRKFFKVVINVSKKCSAEVFVDYLTLTMVALRSCETPKLLDPEGGNIPGDFNIFQHRREKDDSMVMLEVA